MIIPQKLKFKQDYKKQIIETGKNFNEFISDQKRKSKYVIDSVRNNFLQSVYGPILDGKNYVQNHKDIQEEIKKTTKDTLHKYVIAWDTYEDKIRAMNKEQQLIAKLQEIINQNVTSKTESIKQFVALLSLYRLFGGHSKDINDLRKELFDKTTIELQYKNNQSQKHQIKASKTTASQISEININQLQSFEDNQQQIIFQNVQTNSNNSSNEQHPNNQNLQNAVNAQSDYNQQQNQSNEIHANNDNGNLNPPNINHQNNNVNLIQNQNFNQNLIQNSDAFQQAQQFPNQVSASNNMVGNEISSQIQQMNQQAQSGQFAQDQLYSLYSEIINEDQDLQPELDDFHPYNMQVTHLKQSQIFDLVLSNIAEDNLFRNGQ